MNDINIDKTGPEKKEVHSIEEYDVDHAQSHSHRSFLKRVPAKERNEEIFGDKKRDRSDLIFDLKSNPNKKPRHPFRHKWIFIVIPLIIILYLLIVNFVIPTNTRYSYDIGSDLDAKTPYLTPVDRMSNITNDTRTVTNNLVYFNIEMPTSFNTLSMDMNIIPSLSLDSQVLLGSQNNDSWSYTNKIVYSPLLEALRSYNYSGDDVRVYSLKNKSAINISSIPQNLKIVTNMDLDTPANTKKYDIKPLTISTSLRGAHRFYIYVKNNLTLSVKKQDLNWYNGSDNLTIKLYDAKNNLLTNITIVDDGNEGNNKTSVPSNIQSGTLTKSLKDGVYILEFSDFDGLIREIKLNTNKIVTNKLFLADNSGYTNKTIPSNVYYLSKSKSNIEFLTYHNTAFQNVTINNATLKINDTNTNYYSVDAKEYNIVIPKSDMIVTVDGFMTFSKDNYFEPYTTIIDSIPSTIKDLVSYDYVILNMSQYKDYTYTDNNIVHASFNANETFVKNNKLNMMVTVQKFSKDNTIAIDYINVTVHKNGILQR